MLAFLNAVLDRGIALVSLGAAQPATMEQMEPVLREMDQRRRSQLAHEAPALDLGAAAWAAGVAYEAARLLVARDVDAEGVAKAFALPFPHPRVASVDYSADLTLCFLPDLHRLAVRLSPGDPLAAQFVRLGGIWPLSSVGMAGVRPESLEPFIHDACLRQLYVDRILAVKDLSRLEDSRVANAARQVLGGFPDLCPEAAEMLGVAAIELEAGIVKL